MTFQFAWAGPAETSFGPEHEREDEEVFAFWLEHTEGDFPTLSIDIRNPRRQYLAEAADLWMWLSKDGQRPSWAAGGAAGGSARRDRAAQLCRAPDRL